MATKLVSGNNDGEADHITPFSSGGKTSVENCQILSPAANRAKGGFNFQPRKWQVEFLRNWQERTTGSPYMLIAIPGGGKTMAALEACRRWMAAGADRRVICVVPTANLREQWRDEATQFGIDLQTKEFGTNFKDGFQGAVATYHLVASQPLIFRKLCSVAPTLVIFDEVHHCGDEAHFGKGIVSAFELARERLLMSGTPWKSDGTPIPFVKYDGSGFAVGDFYYDYPRALNEGVVRHLVFDYSKGRIENTTTGQDEQLCQDTEDHDARKRLKKLLLDANGEFVSKQIASAHERLIECRKTVPDAAAMAACIDQGHAVRVAETIERVTGCKPSLIVSDSGIENDTVREFRKSNSEWLVAVRKVSEGTDIKRLQVLCYLTNTTSELFFRQLIGRVSRVRGLEDFEGYIYLPADPRLIRCARNIENAQVQALRQQIERESRELKGEAQSEFEFDTYATKHDGTDLAFIAGEAIPVDEYNKIKQMAEVASVPLQKVLLLSQLFDELKQGQATTAPETQGKEERQDDLRKKCRKRAYRLAALRNVDVAEVHRQFAPQKLLNEAQLRDKLTKINRWIARELDRGKS